MCGTRGAGGCREYVDGSGFVVRLADNGATDGHNYNLSMHDVVLYSRKGCHLCDVVKETLTNAQKEADFRWREVDIDTDTELRRQYTDEVPVVFINGRKAFKYRMDEREFLRVLEGRE